MTTNWRDWEIPQDLATGKLENLVIKDSTLTFADDIKICWGPSKIGSKTVRNRIWNAFQHEETGDIWVRRSNQHLTKWDHQERLLFVPSGSTRPTIAFDQNANYVLAVEFLPAGATQKEIWIYEYPYSGAGIRRIVDGQHPLLVNDRHGEIILFYQTADKKQVEYRRAQNFEQAEIAPATDLEEPFPAGFRLILKEYANYLEYRHAFFTREEGDSLPRYWLTRRVMELPIKDNAGGEILLTGFDCPEYAFNVTMTFVDMFTQQPIDGAEVKFRGKTYLTDADGKVDFGKIGAYPSDSILVTHENYPDASYEFQIRQDEDFIFEVMGDLIMQDEAAAKFDAAIEWESMIRPLVFTVTHNGDPVEGATLEIDGFSNVTDENGHVEIFGLIGGTTGHFSLSHPDFNHITSGTVVIPEEIEGLPLQMWEYPPPNQPLDIAEANFSVEEISWIDMRYQVTIQIFNYQTGQAVAGAEIEFAGETKITGADGKATFEKVVPYPTVEFYEIKVNGNTEAHVRVSGYDETKEITIPVQVGANILPLENKDEVTAEITAGSILWVEVEAE